MARTKTSPRPQPQPSTPVKDPWDREHEDFIKRHPNGVASSEAIYTGVVHKGFDADTTAEELIRRYPAFQETEEHRNFLVNKIRERLGICIWRDRDGYYTPQELWEEDDRINGKKSFTRNDEESWADESEDEEDLELNEAHRVEPERLVLSKPVPKGLLVGEDELESNEELAQLCGDSASSDHAGTTNSSLPPKQDSQDAAAAMTDNDLVELFGPEPAPNETGGTDLKHEQEDPKNDEHPVEPIDEVQLPVTLQLNDRTLNIAQDPPDVQLDPDAKMTAISSIDVDGTFILAALGHIKAAGVRTNIAHSDSLSESTHVNGEDFQHLADSASEHSKANDQKIPIAKSTSKDEWNILTQRPHRAAITFLSGNETISALMNESFWFPDGFVATTTKYRDGRTLVVMVGEQSELETSEPNPAADQIDPADRFDNFFESLRKHKSIPPQHFELLGRLQVLHKDMVEANALDAPSTTDDISDTESESEIEIPKRNGRPASDHIEALRACESKMGKRLYLAKEAQKLSDTASLSYSEERLDEILQRPDPDYVYFSHKDGQQQLKLAQQAEKASTQSRRAPQQRSDFPSGFGEALAVPTATHKATVTGKRSRALSDDGHDEDTDNDDEVISRPQKRLKTVQVKSETEINSKVPVKGKQEASRFPVNSGQKRTTPNATSNFPITGKRGRAASDDESDGYPDSDGELIARLEKKLKKTVQVEAETESSRKVPTTGKRTRAASDDEDDDYTDSDGELVARPQKKLKKTVQVKDETKANSNGNGPAKGKGKKKATPKTKSEKSGQPQKKKKYHAPMTAAQSARAIADVKAKLAMFETAAPGGVVKSMEDGEGVDDALDGGMNGWMNGGMEYEEDEETSEEE